MKGIFAATQGDLSKIFCSVDGMTDGRFYVGRKAPSAGQCILPNIRPIFLVRHAFSPI
jgi:hypothetical protein